MHSVRFNRCSVDVRVGLASIGGSLLGSIWNKAANPAVLLHASSGLMLVAAYGIWRLVTLASQEVPLRSLSPAAAPAVALTTR